MDIQDPEVLYEVRGQVAVVTINRPDKRNAIGATTIGALIEAIGRAREDAGVGAIVLTGAGKVFCAGGDLSQMAGREAGEARPTGSFVDLNLAFTRAGKPTVAMVNGHATAAGLGLVVACDLAVASSAAEFGTPEIKRGLWPMMIMATMFRNLPRKKAMELILTGERISADEAERIGLVNRVVPPDRLEAETLALAEKVAGHSPTVVRLGLDAFHRSAEMPFAEALEYLQQRLFAVLMTEDAREGLMAFLEKREPRWKGR